jgi:hypothetical protein
MFVFVFIFLLLCFLRFYEASGACGAQAVALGVCQRGEKLGRCLLHSTETWFVYRLT